MIGLRRRTAQTEWASLVIVDLENFRSGSGAGCITDAAFELSRLPASPVSGYFIPEDCLEVIQAGAQGVTEEPKEPKKLRKILWRKDEQVDKE